MDCIPRITSWLQVLTELKQHDVRYTSGKSSDKSKNWLVRWYYAGIDKHRTFSIFRQQIIVFAKNGKQLKRLSWKLKEATRNKVNYYLIIS